MLTVVTISAMQRRAREWQARRRPARRARAAVAAGTRPAAKLTEQFRALIATQPQARPDYLEFFDPQTLLPVRPVRQGTRVALAVFIGQTRLIDNAAL